MRKFSQIVIIAIASLAMMFAITPQASALDPFNAVCKDNAGAAICKEKNSQRSVGSLIRRITNVMMMLIGAVSIIMLIYGGIRFTASGGSPESIKTAKNTIIYAVAGIVVALAAYAVVNFVIMRII